MEKKELLPPQKSRNFFCKYKLHTADAQGTQKGRQGTGRKTFLKKKHWEIEGRE